MRPSRLGLPLLTVAAVILAGCTTPVDPLLNEAEIAQHAHDMSSWSLSLTGCEEGGFVASSFQVRSGPWARRDIRPEVGPDYLAAVPRTGNWHNGIRCETAVFNETETKDFHFGWVGVGIEAPAFDPGGAAQHFLLAGFGLQPSEARNALLATINADISHTRASTVTWLSDGIVETIYDDKDKGVYGGKGLIVPYRDVPERTNRYWWTVPANGMRIIHDHHGTGGAATEAPEGGFVPVYWDMHATASKQWSSPSDRSSHTTHTGTTDHGSGPVTQGEIGEINSNVVYHYPELTVTFGGIVEGVTIENEWVH